MPTKSTDNDLLVKLQPMIKSIVQWRLRKWPAHFRDEIEANILVEMWQRQKRFDPARGSVETFARKVVRNLISDELRRIKHNRPDFVLLEDEVAIIDDDIEQAQLAMQIRAHPEKFIPAPLLKVFRALEKYDTATAAAKAVGVTVESFYVLSTRLKQHLKEKFQLRSDEDLRIAN